MLAYAVTRERPIAAIVAPIACLGALMFLFVVVRGHDDLLGWALGLGGAAYVVATIAHGTHVDEAAPLVAVALLLSSELGAWSLDERLRIPAERGVFAVRLAAVAALLTASLAVSALVVSLSLSAIGNGLVWTLSGCAAAVGLLALLVRVARAS